MKIYTKTGDKGQTKLYDGHPVTKDDIRVESYGTIDELNSNIGFAKNFITEEHIFDMLEKIQRLLFNVAGELATYDSDKFPEPITIEDIQFLENLIDKYIKKMGNPEFRFILPGSNKESAALHITRTVCRRAERRIITLSGEIAVRPELIKFVNRLSDTLYTFARFIEDKQELIYFKNTDT